MQTQTTHRRRYTRKGNVIVKAAVGLALIAGAVAGAVVLMDDNGNTQNDNIALYTVASGDFDVSIVATGELQAKNSTVVRSQLETRESIVKLVEEGSFVHEGDLLVELSSEQLRDRLENEMLSLESARSDLVGAKNAYEIQVSDNESALRQAQVRLDLGKLEKNKWIEGDDVEKVRQLELDVKANGDELERLREKLDRSEELNQQKFLSGDQLKQDRLAFTRAQADYEKAQLRKQVYEEFERQMEITKLDNEIEEAIAELDRVKRKNESNLASKQASVTNAQRQLAVRETRVSKLEEQLKNCRILAPASGLVVYASSLEGGGWRGNDEPLAVGKEIRPNEELISLPNSTEMIATIKVHESLVGRVKQGQKAVVRIDALRGTVVDGVVDSVGVVAESGGWRDPNLREYAVNVLLDIADPQELSIKPSMRCEATLFIEHVQDAVHIPVQAVFFEDRTTVVYARHSTGKFERTPVTLGRRSDQDVEIVAGIDTGERVLLRKPAPGEIMETQEVKPAKTDRADAG